MITESKVELRKRMLSRLLSLTEEEIERRSKNVTKNIKEVSFYRKAKTIMAYYPLKGEVDILGMIREEFTKREFCFPVIDMEKRNLLPYWIYNLDTDFVVGPYGVREPNLKKAKLCAIKDIDLIFVPALAFDRNKYRLGRGGGFYDRFLRQRDSHTIVVGLAFDFQIVDVLPLNLPQDQSVDYIITDKFYL